MLLKHESLFNPIEKYPYRPKINFNRTLELIQNIPEDNWQVPAPFGEWSHYGQGFFNSEVDEWIVPWFKFLQSVDEGYNISQEGNTKGLIRGGVEELNAYMYFYKRTDEVQIPNNLKTSPDILNALKRTLRVLLRDQTQQELIEKGILIEEDLIPPKDEDISLTRALVKEFKKQDTILDRMPLRPL